MTLLRSFLRDEHGSTAAEFVLVLPILLIFIFGVLDTGWYAWNMSLNQKAAEMGARVAVVTGPAPVGLAGDYVGKVCGTETLQQGDPIPADCMDTIVCDAGNGLCEGFGSVVDRMTAINPMIAGDNVEITYSGSGLGYAGDPNAAGVEVAPFVTVAVKDIQYNPLMGLVMASIPMPRASHTLTMEDGDGDKSF